MTSPSPLASRKHPAGGYRELLVLAVPLMISAGTQSLMHHRRILLTWYSHGRWRAARQECCSGRSSASFSA